MEILSFSKKDIRGNLTAVYVFLLYLLVEKVPKCLLNEDLKDCPGPTGTFELLGKHSYPLRTSSGTKPKHPPYPACLTAFLSIFSSLGLYLVSHRSFELRTLKACVSSWLIAPVVLIYPSVVNV